MEQIPPRAVHTPVPLTSASASICCCDLVVGGDRVQRRLQAQSGLDPPKRPVTRDVRPVSRAAAAVDGPVRLGPVLPQDWRWPFPDDLLFDR